MRRLQLTIELVPSSSFYNNMRKILVKEEWDKIRKATYKYNGYQCAICNIRDRLNCHEIWEYNDKRHIQKLKGFVALCNLCHYIKHIGFAQILADRGQLDYESVVKHFMDVNNCNRETFQKHRAEAFAKWKERSRYKWTIDLGKYQ